jgi:fatty acid desaturase
MLILARDAFPGAGVENRRFAVRTTLILLTAVLLMAAALFGAYPLLLAPTAAGETAVVLIAALTAPLHWGLMHESIHGKLYESEAWNRRIGRLLGITLCLDWDMMRFGHLLHHRANRHERDRPEELRPGQSWLSAAGPFFFQLLGGQELGGMIAPLTVVLPLGATEWITRRIFAGEPNTEARMAALRAFGDPARRRRIRIDFAAILALIVFAAWCWGAHWPVLALAIAARFAVLSLLDNAPHYGTPRDSGAHAYNTALARPFRWLVLNSNFHGMHHQASHLGWQELPGEFAQTGAGYDGSWIAAVLRQFRGPRRLS